MLPVTAEDEDLVLTLAGATIFALVAGDAERGLRLAEILQPPTGGPATGR